MNVNSRFSHWFYNPESGNYTDTFLEEDLIEDTYFIYGPGYAEIYRQFNELIGPEPMLPRKAYGFFQTQHLSCNGTQQKLLDLANTLREREIPCDNLIIDFEWGDGCDGEKELTWGNLDWAPTYTSPLSPQEMFDSLHAMNFNVMLIHHSGPGFASRKNQGWTEQVFDEEMWWKKFSEKLEIGMDGTWQDTRRNDITDSYIWHRSQKHFGGDQRILFLGCRKMQAVNYWDAWFTAAPTNQLIGARRYPFDWTGDCSYSWNELRWQIQAITNTHGSLKGVSYITSDAFGSSWKIQARWNQFCDFSTLSRSHNLKPWTNNIDLEGFLNNIQISGRIKLFADQNAQNTPEEISDQPKAEESIRKHRKLRYRLLPYIYSTAYQNYLEGMPVCRPMMIAFPEDHRCNANQWPYQYFLGENLLVAPVYGDFNSMEIYLPKGNDWIDYWDGTKYEGGQILHYNTADVSKLPLFVKAGAIIPMRQEMDWIDPAIPDELTIDIYPSGDSDFQLYEDDGLSMQYQNEGFGLTTISCEFESPEKLKVHISVMKGSYEGKPQNRSFSLQLNSIEKSPKDVFWNVKKLPNSGRDSWFFNENKKQVIIRFETKTDDEDTMELNF